MAGTIDEPTAALMSRQAPQDALLDLLTSDLQALNQRVDVLVRPVDPRLRITVPTTGGWSIDMVLEHLCLTNDAYLPAIRAALARPGAPRVSGDWRRTLMGWVLVRSMVSKQRLPSPKAIAPGPLPRPHVLDAFLETNVALGTVLLEASEREWRRVRLASPLARLVRMNIGDAALAVLRHGERHEQQMVRVARAVGA